MAKTKNPKLKFTKGNNCKNSWNRVMVLVHRTSPQCDLCMKFEVTSFNTFEVMPWITFRDTRTDRCTDRWTDRMTPVFPPPPRNFVCRGIMNQYETNISKV